MLGSGWRRERSGLASLGALEAGVKSTDMGGEFRESHVRGDMAAGKRQGAARLCGPEFDIEEGAGVTGLSRQTEFSFAHGRRVAEGISEGPDDCPVCAPMAFQPGRAV